MCNELFVICAFIALSFALPIPVEEQVPIFNQPLKQGLQQFHDEHGGGYGGYGQGGHGQGGHGHGGYGNGGYGGHGGHGGHNGGHNGGGHGHHWG